MPHSLLLPKSCCWISNVPKHLASQAAKPNFSLSTHQPGIQTRSPTNSPSDICLEYGPSSPFQPSCKMPLENLYPSPCPPPILSLAGSLFPILQ
ncbi:unnamed protein product, partial [Gulo gulo]